MPCPLGAPHYEQSAVGSAGRDDCPQALSSNIFPDSLQANCTNCWWPLTLGGYFLKRNRVCGDPRASLAEAWRSEKTGDPGKETY